MELDCLTHLKFDLFMENVPNMYHLSCFDQRRTCTPAGAVDDSRVASVTLTRLKNAEILNIPAKFRLLFS